MVQEQGYFLDKEERCRPTMDKQFLYEKTGKFRLSSALEGQAYPILPEKKRFHGDKSNCQRKRVYQIQNVTESRFFIRGNHEFTKRPGFRQSKTRNIIRRK